MKRRLLSAAILAAACLAPLTAAAADSAALRVDPLGSIPIDLSTLIFSRNQDHFAAVAPFGPRAAVDVDGRLTRKYDEIIAAGPQRKPYMIFNSTGEHFAFLARRGPTTVFVIDGQEQPLPDNVAISAAHFSPDGSQFAIAFSTPGQPTQILVNGKSLGLFQNASMPRFSSNSKHIGFIATTPNGLAAIIDGRPGPNFQNVANLEFSPDGDHFAYIGTGAFPGDALAHLVVDGWKLAAFDRISSVKFSPAGDHILFVGESAPTSYPAGVPAQTTVGFDDLRWPAAPDAAKHFAPQLSPDGSRVAYIESSARDPRLLVVTVNGAHSREYADITNLAFSPDASHLTYAASDGRSVSVILDANSFDPVDALLTPPIFSADSRHLMFLAQRSGIANPRAGERYDFNRRQPAPEAAPILVIDNRTYPVPRSRDNGAPSQLQFSPDANHIAYTLGAANLIVDGQPVAFPDRTAITDLRFTPDSQHLFFTTPDPNNPGQTTLVIDNQFVPGFSLRTHPIPLADGTLSAFAVDARSNTLCRLSITPAPVYNFGIAAAQPIANPDNPPPNRNRLDKNIDKAKDAADKLHNMFNR